jgi:hypothetical protein
VKKFTSVIDPQKMETILKFMKVTEIAVDGSSVKRIDFSSYAGPGYLIASEYGSSMKMFVEVKPKYWHVVLEEDECPPDLKVLAQYVVEQNRQFQTKEEASEYVKNLSAAKYLIPVEVDPNEEKPKNSPVSSTDEIPF